MTRQLDPLVALILQGSNLTEEQAQDLEKVLVVDPNNFNGRVQVLGYYSRKQYSIKAAKEKYIEQIFWWIEHQPDYADAIAIYVSAGGRICTPQQFGEARELWYDQLEKYSGNGRIYGNAGAFVIWRDLETGEKLLKQASNLDATNSQWPGWISMFNYFEFSSGIAHYRKYHAERTIEFGKIELDLGSAAPF